MTPGMETPSSIQRALDTCVAAGAPGALVVISAPRSGVTFACSSGCFERDGPRALEVEDPFRAASVSKAVTAALAVRLASEGRFGLDDSVAPFLPTEAVEVLGRLEGLEDGLEGLTFRRLLGHTSGLPDYFFDAGFQAHVQARPNRMWRPIELVRAAAEIGCLDFPPGKGFAYGDTGYVVVGLAVEQIAERSLAEAYRSWILEPLGMHSTWLEWHEPARRDEISHHYEADRDLLPMNTSFDWAGGGLVTTAHDLTRFLEGLFAGRLFGDPWLDEVTRWVPRVSWRRDASARYLRYGLGVGANRAAGEEIIGATGVWGAFAYYWPRGRAAIAGTVNLRGLDRGPLLDALVAALEPEIAFEPATSG